jgi:transcriptional regulator with XRE-family HTH domain
MGVSDPMPSKKSPANQALGEAIRAIRNERTFSQEAFAVRAGLDRGYYGAVERGEFNITVDTLVKIAVGLEVSVAALFDRARL